ncbi:DUF1501 domain-containing protein [Rubritalea profundi]|uniref:Sulfatase n=1 Tax=Rubritalea profundi TaxID=1658618 RepID=A0A2S7TYI6_9BACT|nr:DUF1501 domain-containing protein [Rubritalea profundi]PQJ27380.1 sulfatase [Rubritalea profundi]
MFPNSTLNDTQRSFSRRWFMKDCGLSLGSVALTTMLGKGAASASQVIANPQAPKAPHFPAKAKNVIFLYMGGAPSHLDLFDNKPELRRMDGTVPPPELLKGYQSAFIRPNNKLLGSKFEFKRYGNCGMEMADILPHIGSCADDISLIRSMQTDAFNHAPAQILMSTGSQQFGRPSLGSWVSYGLGSENQNLPSFVVMSSGTKGPSAGNSNWSSGFLPSVHDGVTFNSTGEPVLYLSNPKGITRKQQRDTIDAVNFFNDKRLKSVGDPEINSRLAAFEMAFRMQDVAPEVTDISLESEKTIEMYGAEPGKASFANNCLLARRLVERGVRFVELFHESWDQHGNLEKDLKKNCKDVDKACAALVKDLKQRGLLDETLIVWGGEFGRTPMVQGGNDGRDHHPNAFSMWMAGGGVKGGMELGKTDDLGFNAVEDKVHVHDLNATILHLLGFDHTKLTTRSQGRDFRLTDVHGNVVNKILV